MSSEDAPRDNQVIPENLEDFTFDEWKELHDSDPQKFETCRLKILDDLIDSAPEQSKPRLRGLMFQMEGESRRCKSQLGYNLRLSSMMMEMLNEMREQLFLLYATDVNDMDKASLNSERAQVIPFAPPDGQD